MKKLIIFCLVLMVLVIPVSAAEDLLVDDADLLTYAQETELEAGLRELTEKYNMSVVIVTTDSVGEKDTVAYADDFLDYNGYGEDGILLLINMEDRQWHISTVGEAVSAFSEDDLAQIEDGIVDYLSDGNYMSAFEEFISQCDDILDNSFAWGTNLIFALVVGLVVSLIVVFCLKRQLKSVKRQYTASDYVRPGSLQLTGSGEIFLYHTVSRIEKPKPQSGSGTHRSSSGRMHGGRGGRF